MSTVSQVAPPSEKLSTLPLEQTRGIQAMRWLIATEAMLFACLFAAYYYLGNNKPRWTMEAAPDLWVPFTLLGIVILGGIAMYWGDRQVTAGRSGLGRMAVWFTVLCGIAFLCLEGYEFSFTWHILAPYNDSYGSIFYTIDFLDCAHVAVGVLILMFVGILPELGPSKRTPHLPLKTAALYWYFVIVLWFVIVMLLYVTPNLQRANLHS